MLTPLRLAALPLALALLLAGQGAAHAFTAPFVLLDMMIKQSTKEALATPGHAEWCARSRPGYRPQWNNWRTPDGRVTYCSSPYYTVPWQPKR
ncbi:MAG: hypothetical protein BroJett030_08870 [Alphaproteobacteria bacterium]|nr:MAG: hypothetical protein BroJett030_08870 [Alphaproteobacteria bacterium]